MTTTDPRILSEHRIENERLWAQPRDGDPVGVRSIKTSIRALLEHIAALTEQRDAYSKAASDWALALEKADGRQQRVAELVEGMEHAGECRTYPLSVRCRNRMPKGPCDCIVSRLKGALNA